MSTVSMHMCMCVSMEAEKLELQGATNKHVWVWGSKFLSSVIAASTPNC